MRGARLARMFWNDPEYADELERSAADLKRRFNRDFWVSDGRYFALALDEDGRQVDTLSSNIGHLLWSGIVDKTKARAIVGHLMGPRLFSGWGVRTLAAGEQRFNPIGYHTGTVWPFDNSFIAWGLRRYGFKQEAARIAAGILDAAAFFDGRLPEAFGGYDRALTRYPVEYPTACSPQAWSTGAPLLLLRTMLGLDPIGDHLTVDPALPMGIGHVGLLDIPGRWGQVDAFGRGRVEQRMARPLRRTESERGVPSDPSSCWYWASTLGRPAAELELPTEPAHRRPSRYDGRGRKDEAATAPGRRGRQDFGTVVGALVGLGTTMVEDFVPEEFDERNGFSIGDWDVLAEIPEGTAAALLLLEHRWAIPLRDAVTRAGGSRLASEFVSPLDLVAFGMVSAGEAQELVADESDVL